MRNAEKERKTLETEIKLKLNLDGNGKHNIKTPIKFFTHMLEQLSAHGNFDIDLMVKSNDDDAHHVVEDVAITLGEAFKDALGEKRGINRYGSFILPMDDALCLSVVDFSGRPYSKTTIQIKDERTSDFETVLLPHFINSFAVASAATIHVKMLDGFDTHHIIESVFKSLAHSLKIACAIDENQKDKIPSTKGVL